MVVVVGIVAMSRSVWNNAGTWEEKDCTEWALGLLRDSLASVATDNARVDKVRKVNGVSSLHPTT